MEVKFKVMALKFSQALVQQLTDCANGDDSNPLHTMAKIELFRPSLPSLVSEVSEIDPVTGKKKRVLKPLDSWADLSTIMGAQASMSANAALAAPPGPGESEGAEGQGNRKKRKLDQKLPMHIPSLLRLAI
jgi:hypothetical protein